MEQWDPIFGVIVLGIVVALILFFEASDRDERSRLQRMKNTTCTHCGAKIDFQVLTEYRNRARQRYQECSNEMRRQNWRGIRPFRSWPFECPNCGMRGHFSETHYERSPRKPFSLW